MVAPGEQEEELKILSGKVGGDLRKKAAVSQRAFPDRQGQRGGPKPGGLGPVVAEYDQFALGGFRLSSRLEPAACLIGFFGQTHQNRHDPGVAFIGLGINKKSVRQK